MQHAVRYLLLAFAVAVVAAGAFILTRTSGQAVTVIKSSAQAWIWVPRAEQPHMKRDIEAYARKKRLRFEVFDVPAPWKMVSLRLRTEAGNQIEVVNATDPEKFSVSILVFEKRENWGPYWREFRAFAASHYKWQDIR